MAYIKVDHSEFEKTAREIDDYIRYMRNRMNAATSEVTGLGATWQGKDYETFKQRWERVTYGDSTYAEMIKALDAYADYLRYAGNQYKNAQTNAVNRANWLPK